MYEGILDELELTNIYKGIVYFIVFLFFLLLLSKSYKI